MQSEVVSRRASEPGAGSRARELRGMPTIRWRAANMGSALDLPPQVPATPAQQRPQKWGGVYSVQRPNRDVLVLVPGSVRLSRAARSLGARLMHWGCLTGAIVFCIVWFGGIIAV